MTTPQKRLADNLLTLLRTGQFAQAESIARILTQREPHNAFGWKVFGSLLALDANRLTESLSVLERARRLAPQDAEILNSLAQANQGLGRLEESIELYRHALALQPQRPEFWNNLGWAQQACGRLDEALTSYERALALQPAYAKAHNYRGCALRELDRLEEALASHDRALALDPDNADALNNRGLALQALGRAGEALDCYAQALAIRPHDADIIVHQGSALSHLGRFDEALNRYAQALRIAPASADAYANQSLAMRALGRDEDALASLNQALAIKPDHVGALNNRGMLLRELGQLDDALASLDAALAIRPNDAEALTNRGNALKDQGQLEESLVCYRRALEARPQLIEAAHNRLLCLNYLADLTREQVFVEHRAFERDQAARIPRLPPVMAANQDPERRLRLGLVSGDFRHHSVTFFILPILERLDRQRFEVFCYSTSPRRDELTQRFQSLADGWIETIGLQPLALAERIRADRIDLLFDLSGHTDGNALLAFAAKPAPIQITWIGYPNTTGLTTMDYRLVDAVTDPPEEADAWHTETLVRLPMGFLCYRPGDAGMALPVGPLPALSSGRITFGSFNNLAKLTTATVDVWASVLRTLPDARLRLKSHTTTDRRSWDRLLGRFAAQGIAPERLESLPRAPSYTEHLEQYRDIDIALDTFPYHGTTTTCEALFMGVPVITLIGDRHASRVGASLLTHIGLPELIAASPEDYARIACDLARDPQRLDSLRKGLRKRLECSPLRDEIGFTRTLEGVLRQMWRFWRAGESPQAFALEPESMRAERRIPERLTAASDPTIVRPEAEGLPMSNRRQRRARSKLANTDAKRSQGTRQRREHPLQTPGATSPTPSEQDTVIGLFEQGRYDKAETAARQLVERYPTAMFGWKMLGTVLVQSNRSDEALPLLLEANRLAPGNAECINTLGLALKRLGRIDEALGCYRRALEIQPDYALAHNNLGVALSDLGRFEQALTCYERALAIDPALPGASGNRCLTIQALGRLDDALACFDQVLTGKPNAVETLNHRGILLQDLGRLNEALASFDKALAIRPQYAAALSNRSNLLKDQGRLDEALAGYRQAIELQPDLREPWHNRLLCLNYQANLSADAVFAEHQTFNRYWAGKIQPLPAPVTVNRDPERRLRIGLVSGDFRQHSVAFFVLPILEQLDRRQFQVFCYPTSSRRDDLTHAFQRLADCWIESAGFGQDALAARIRADQIDLLLDLSGHTDGNALLAFAAKPAPVQITWIGYPNTTGLRAMDYRLVDAVTDLPGAADARHTETLIRLPMGFLCYRPLTSTVAVAPSPCLKNRRITFGSFNHLAKLTPATLDLWAGILKAVPDARLLLKSNRPADHSVWERLLAHFATRGIAAERLELLLRTDAAEDHLALYGRVDIALDTFPYHGTTTTCEALFMGVPVVTLAGDHHAARVGASLLTRVGLPELIATLPEDYTRIAFDLTADREHLSRLRASLRERLERSPLRDEVGFTRTLEAALRQMWRIWCRGERPHVFDVQHPV